MTYRDDLASASTRLARLDEAHASRAYEARRRVLEEERAGLTGSGGGVAPVVFYASLVAAFVSLRQVLLHHGSAMRGSRELLVLSLLVAGVLGISSFWRKNRRLEQVTGIDATLLELAPEAHIPPATLAEAHERIRARETEEEAIARRASV